METDKDHIEEQEQQPSLSGAYIHGLVKHLSSKDSSDGSENGECFHDVNSKPPKHPPPQHKKQVRRRLHTTKPYQERLLNMAEARREIVTALKFHRASMKQQEAATATAAVAAASNNHQSPPQSSFNQERKTKTRPILSLHPPDTTTITANPYWPMFTFAPPPPPLPPSYLDNHNFILPSQPLGLNLNFQSFANLDTDIYHKPLSVYSSSSTSSSTPSSTSSPAFSGPPGNPNSSTNLHQAMNADVMQETKSSGEQDQIEWWCNFYKSMEIEVNQEDKYDQNMEFPPWLINANESSCLQQKFDDHFSDTYFQDPALPW
ncbi:protein AAL-toxin resistant 7-like [Bidens hawaiensis]|uniref:protein AAL-toxin resistant 7-like n=1 Tax=Bidens hawaiensis TaxID=980011 RepID=UPI00404B6635